MRIISLKPNITEILYALGAGDSIVGATTWCDLPTKNLPRVADYIHTDIEKIIALEPDLIIGSKENSDSKSISKLQKLGYKTLILPFGTIKEMFSSMASIGEVLGKVKESALLIEGIKKEIGAIQNGINTAITPNVLMIVGRRPLIAAGPDTFLGEILKLVHANNIIGDVKIKYPHVSIETVFARRPDIIINLSMGSETNRTEDNLASTGAKTISLPMEKFRAGPGLPLAVKMLKEAIYK